MKSGMDKVKEQFDLTNAYVTAPATTPTVALAGAGAGNLTNGVYYYKISYVTSVGETEPSSASALVTVADATTDGQVALTAIPTSTDTRVIKRRIYRTLVDETAIYHKVADISDNSTTTYTDNIADASLGEPPIINTTSGVLLDKNDIVIGAINEDGASAAKRGTLCLYGHGTGESNRTSALGGISSQHGIRMATDPHSETQGAYFGMTGANYQGWDAYGSMSFYTTGVRDDDRQGRTRSCRFTIGRTNGWKQLLWGSPVQRYFTFGGNHRQYLPTTLAGATKLDSTTENLFRFHIDDDVHTTGAMIDVMADSGAAKTVEDISKANPAQVTITGHGYSTGDWVHMWSSGSVVMIEPFAEMWQITKIDADNFTLTGCNTTSSLTYDSSGTPGRCQLVRRLFSIDKNGTITFENGATIKNTTSGSLDLGTTTQVPVVPTLTTAERDALSAVNGMIVYNSTTTTMQGYINGSWTNV